VADQDGRLVRCPDERVVVVDDLLQAEAGELVGVLAELLDVTVLAGPLRCADGEAARAEVVAERLPAAGRQPRAVDEQQRDPIAVTAGAGQGGAPLGRRPRLYATPDAQGFFGARSTARSR
jgi:hypothetical protein